MWLGTSSAALRILAVTVGQQGWLPTAKNAGKARVCRRYEQDYPTQSWSEMWFTGLQQKYRPPPLPPGFQVLQLAHLVLPWVWLCRFTYFRLDTINNGMLFNAVDKGRLLQRTVRSRVEGRIQKTKKRTRSMVRIKR
eukprot:GHVQ01024202.1.p3 GENE.GHVQ01024202.1~~GHVQ01024202.1.p3  ORF type:complete len:137 (+),score=4.73 GHVQ01024202.1:512-922(+)